MNSIDDLAAMVLGEITEPVNIVAQSMGGLIAIKLALAVPTLVNRLVLAVTAGGVPIADLGGSNWRTEHFTADPGAASWIADPTEDLSEQIRSISAPTLLLWGDNDPISPVAVGKRLLTLLPYSRLSIIAGADHDLAQTHTETVAAEIRHHLTADI